MKTAFKEFCRETVQGLQGDQDTLAKHSLKASCRKLVRKDDAERKAKRKAVKMARKRNR